MDFPMFHLDWLNNRMLIAGIATLHVIINHGLAVGFMPLVTWLEQKGLTKSSNNEITDLNWDKTIYKMMKVAFIITTTIGAMTGVGIWFSASLISPTSIGSLIRVFYWAWFVEWLTFVTEVILIMIYFLTWKNSNSSLKSKVKHIRLGWYLSISSWITMAIIVGILGFMMDPGNWLTNKTLASGFTNPLYLPQLLFRTPMAMLMAGVFAMLLITIFTKYKSDRRILGIKSTSQWIAFWAPLTFIGAWIYYKAIPEGMTANMSTAVGTIDFAQYYGLLKYLIIGGVSLSVVLSIVGLFKAKYLRTYMIVLPVIFVFAFLGFFERVREFVRKPYVIGQYMYSNLLLEEDYPIYQRDGVLKHATYSSVKEINEDNKLQAGKEVFIIACSRCHTAQGVNSVVRVFERMVGSKEPLNIALIQSYLPNMHTGRNYMPPFPGNEKEAEALALFIRHLQLSKDIIEGAQTEGIEVNPEYNTENILQKQNSNKNELTSTL